MAHIFQLRKWQREFVPVAANARGILKSVMEIRLVANPVLPMLARHFHCNSHQIYTRCCNLASLFSTLYHFWMLDLFTAWKSSHYMLKYNPYNNSQVVTLCDWYHITQTFFYFQTFGLSAFFKPMAYFFSIWNLCVSWRTVILKCTEITHHVNYCLKKSPLRALALPLRRSSKFAELRFDYDRKINFLSESKV